jgi:hypothetical protein
LLESISEGFVIAFSLASPDSLYSTIDEPTTMLYHVDVDKNKSGFGGCTIKAMLKGAYDCNVIIVQALIWV